MVVDKVWQPDVSKYWKITSALLLFQEIPLLLTWLLSPLEIIVTLKHSFLRLPIPGGVQLKKDP